MSRRACAGPGARRDDAQSRRDDAQGAAVPRGFGDDAADHPAAELGVGHVLRGRRDQGAVRARFRPLALPPGAVETVVPASSGLDAAVDLVMREAGLVPADQG
ncbi:hypothetical protein DEH69_20250 [Streptomyces sp. PT12]|nr:hypothetical protein DEH69_20250 [Streptomyces sp. PT12]